MSKRNHISQAEARRLRRELNKALGRLDLIGSTYAAAYPGTKVGRIDVGPVIGAQLRTAARLGFNLIARHQAGDQFEFFAASRPAEPQP